MVIICGTEAIREALVDKAEVFSGRAKIAVLDPVRTRWGGPQGHWEGTGMGGWGLGRVRLGREGKGWSGDPESP